ncbi:MAG: hypothetical protein ACI9S9_003172 [Planctomycetota bacterium]|jgi:hypothetical protein
MQMRLLSMLMLSAAAVTAQSPLTTTFANNNGGATGGAVYFDLECLDPAGLTISDLDLNFGGAGGLAGSIDVYIIDNTWAPHTQLGWNAFTSGTVAASSAAGTPTNVVLNTPLSLGAGCKIGVAIVNTGLATAYTTATSLPATYATAELELTVGGGSNSPFAGGAFSPRLVNTNINYTSGGSCPTIVFPANVASNGSGCGGSILDFGSFYELAAAGTLDLSGMKLTGTNTGSGYQMSVAAGAGFGVPLGSTNLMLGDDAQAAAGTLGLVVGSNGWMAVGGGNSNAFAPSASTFLNNPSEGVYSWTDLQPNAAGSGAVYYSEFGTTGTATYNGVYGWGTTDPNDIKITYDTSNGDFSIEWGAVGAGNPEDSLVGYSSAGASGDPGAMDISAAGGPDSFYEVQPAGTNDLQGMKLIGTSNGNGYDVTLVPGAGFGVPLGSTNLMLGDDAQTAAGTLGLVVGSNGWMAVGGGNSNGFAPSVSTFLSNPSTGVYSWTDLQPNAAGSGAVYYSEFGTTGTATYNGVYGWNTTSPNDIKITYDTSNGDFSIEWGAIGAGNPEDLLVGYADAAGSADPGASDISVAAPFSIVPPFTVTDGDAVIPNLTLVSIGNPVQGAAAVAFDVTTDNIPAGAVGHLGMLGLSNPDLDLTGLGLPGCFLLSSADVLDFQIIAAPASSVTWTALNLPAGPVFFNGFQFYLQSAIFGNDQNSFLNLGALTSNGLTCTIGDA